MAAIGANLAATLKSQTRASVETACPVTCLGLAAGHHEAQRSGAGRQQNVQRDSRRIAARQGLAMLVLVIAHLRFPLL